MTPTQKAISLVQKFNITSKSYIRKGRIDSVQNSLNCVAEIEAALIDFGFNFDQLQNMDRELNFWQKVKEELESM